MQIAIINEPQDKRVALVPEVCKQLIGLKHTVSVESGCGVSAFYADDDYTEAGAKVVDRSTALAGAELLITLLPAGAEVYKLLKPGCMVLSMFEPFNPENASFSELKTFPLTAVSMDMIPRTSLAQAMDVLSSMASIAGYKAVLEAARHMPRYFPMLTTAAGSIPPAKVLILGAGVAGLQAIATAKRMGAVVEAFDTRLAAKEEVESLGAKFVMVEGAKDDKAAGGYAVEQSEEYKQRQRELIHDKASKADVVITTAQLRGRRAPLLITKETVEKMKPGSVVVDLAASSGGNCELSRNNETYLHNGVTIVGNSALYSEMQDHASRLYAKNIFNFLKMFTDKDGAFHYDFENPILASACILHEGQDRFTK